MKKCTVGYLGKGIFQFNEQNAGGPYVDAYLVTGNRRAVLIDALEEAEDLYERVKQITDLPVDLLITHAHPDHAGKSMYLCHERGMRVFLHHDDLHMFEGFAAPLDESWFSWMEDGGVFDLGGVCLEVLTVKGHTPGSAVFLDRKRELLFSGDAVGSGHFWMQIPGCLPLSVFRTELNRLYENVKEMKNLRIYPGHRAQSPVPLNLQYIKDVMDLTDEILEGKNQGEDKEMDLAGKHILYREAVHGMMRGYCYDPMNI